MLSKEQIEHWRKRIGQDFDGECHLTASEMNALCDMALRSLTPSAIAPTEIVTALEHLESISDFAYEKGFHELGYDPVKLLRKVILAAQPEKIYTKADAEAMCELAVAGYIEAQRRKFANAIEGKGAVGASAAAPAASPQDALAMEEMHKMLVGFDERYPDVAAQIADLAPAASEPVAWMPDDAEYGMEPISDALKRAHAETDHPYYAKHYTIPLYAAPQSVRTNAPLTEATTSKWISVKDRLPEERIRVLASDGHFVEDCFYGIGSSRHGGWSDKAWRTTGYEQLREITHWQPLPSPPMNKHESQP